MLVRNKPTAVVLLAVAVLVIIPFVGVQRSNSFNWSWKNLLLAPAASPQDLPPPNVTAVGERRRVRRDDEAPAIIVNRIARLHNGTGGENVTIMMPANVVRENQLCELFDGLARFGFHDVVIFGEASRARDKMRGNMFFRMASHALRWIAANRDEGENRIVVIIDALDVLATRPASVLLERYRQMGSPDMLVSGDTGCLGTQETCDVYRKAPCWMSSKCPSAWGAAAPRNLSVLCSKKTVHPNSFPDDLAVYPNSGSFMGTAESLHRVMSLLVGTPACNKGIDQGWFVLRAVTLGLIQNGTVFVDIHSNVFGNINSGARAERFDVTIRGLYYDLVVIHDINVTTLPTDALRVQKCWRDEQDLERAVCTVMHANGTVVRHAPRGEPVVFELALGNFTATAADGYPNVFPALMHFSGGGKVMLQLALHTWRQRFPRCAVGLLPNITVVRALGDAVTSVPATRFCPCCGEDGMGPWRFNVRNKTTVAKITATPRPFTPQRSVFRVANSNVFVTPAAKGYDKAWRSREVGPRMAFEYGESDRLAMQRVANLTNVALAVPPCGTQKSRIADVTPAIQSHPAWAMCPT